MNQYIWIMCLIVVAEFCVTVFLFWLLNQNAKQQGTINGLNASILLFAKQHAELKAKYEDAVMAAKQANLHFQDQTEILENLVAAAAKTDDGRAYLFARNGRAFNRVYLPNLLDTGA